MMSRILVFVVVGGTLALGLACGGGGGTSAPTASSAKGSGKLSKPLNASQAKTAKQVAEAKKKNGTPSADGTKKLQVERKKKKTRDGGFEWVIVEEWVLVDDWRDEIWVIEEWVDEDDLVLVELIEFDDATDLVLLEEIEDLELVELEEVILEEVVVEETLDDEGEGEPEEHAELDDEGQHEGEDEG
jgi:hypothetical protein